MSHIHLIGGEKGGVGKSVVARALSQYLLDHGQPLAGVDADGSHKTLLRSYGQYTQSVDLARFSSADEIIDRALAAERRVVVDLPAQSLEDLKLWFDSADLERFARDMNIGVTLWHVTDGGYDSLADLERTLSLFEGQVSYVVVKNLGRAKDFSQFDESPLRRKLEGLGGKVIELPELDAASMFKIDRYGASFWGAIHNTEGDGVLSPMERRRVQTWLDRVGLQFESLGNAF
ncbi:MAG TPA: hypothetical protein VIV60_25435 [Polyangiaceae bacterium]